MPVRKPALTAASLLALAMASVGAVRAQDAPARSDEAGVPASAIVMPGARKPARAGLDGPNAPVSYAPHLARGTPDDQDAASLPQPVSGFIESLERTYWQHPSLLAARARVRSTDFRLPQARAAFGPRLNFEASYGYQRDNVESRGFPPVIPGGWNLSKGWSTNAAAILTQPLFTFGRNSAIERQALAQIAFQRAVLRSTEAETLFNTIRAYAGLLRDRSSIEIFAEDLALLEREYSDNAARFRKREVTSSDVQQVESRVELSRAQFMAAQRTTANAEAAFLSAVGAPAGQLEAPNPLAMPVDSLEEAYAFAELHNPVLAAAYARERISRAELNAAKSGMLPRVDLRGRAEYGSVSPYNDSLRQTQLRGEVVVSGPIFESGARRAQMQEAEAANQADWRLLDEALRENRAEVASAWNEWLAQSASIEPLRRSAEAARKAYDGALIQEKAGFRTTLDVLSLARELLSARTSYNAATANTYIAQARLLAAIGALDQKSLFPDKPAYDPDEHFDKTKYDGMIPIVVPIIKRLDGVFAGQRHERPVRDPSGPLAAPGVDLPVPGTAAAPADEAPAPSADR